MLSTSQSFSVKKRSAISKKLYNHYVHGYWNSGVVFVNFGNTCYVTAHVRDSAYIWTVCRPHTHIPTHTHTHIPYTHTHIPTHTHTHTHTHTICSGWKPWLFVYWISTVAMSVSSDLLEKVERWGWQLTWLRLSLLWLLSVQNLPTWDFLIRS